MTLLKAAFCGTPDFSIPSLKVLHESPQVDLKHVITMPDRPAGRRGKKAIPSIVAQYAEKHHLPLFKTPRINGEKDFIEALKREDLDFIVVIAFSQFLNNEILALPRWGCFNIHPSLLPKYRGAAPIQHAILHGDRETGISIQKMVRKMDAGDLCWQKKMPIPEGITGGELFETLKGEAALGLEEFIDNLREERLTLTPQGEEGLSFAPTLKREDGLLSFEEESAQEIIRKVCAFFPWPGSYFFMNGLRVKVLEVEASIAINVSPGKINTGQGRLLIGCKEGTLRLKQVQLEGKKATSDTDLINGLKNKLDHFALSKSK